MTRQDHPTVAARLAAWVCEGGDPADRPRLDQAIEAYRSVAPKPPAWWFTPDAMPASVDPADYWPQAGSGRGRPIKGWGESAEHSDSETRKRPPRPIDEEALRGPAKVTWKDVLDSTYRGDTIADIARRLGLDRSSLCQRLRNNPGVATRVNEKRGIFTGGRA